MIFFYFVESYKKAFVVFHVSTVVERVIKTAGIVMAMASSKIRVPIMRIRTEPLVRNQWRDVLLKLAQFVADGDAKRNLAFLFIFLIHSNLSCANCGGAAQIPCDKCLQQGKVREYEEVLIEWLVNLFLKF